MKDHRAPDGLVYRGERWVRVGGRVKFAGTWWTHERLKELVGQIVECRVEDYWCSEITVWRPEWRIPLTIKAT